MKYQCVRMSLSAYDSYLFRRKHKKTYRSSRLMRLFFCLGNGKMYNRGIGENMKTNFLINEVAKLHNLSKKTLLYYDRIGLFMPDHIDEETGYRYYIREQFPYLKQIIYLKDLGFSLTEIQELLGDRRFEPLIDKLEEKLTEVNAEIARNMTKKHDLEYLLKFYKEADLIDERDLNHPSIKFFEDRVVMYELCENENSVVEVMLAYRKMLRNLNNMSIFSQMPYGTICMEPTDSSENYLSKVGSFIMLSSDLDAPQKCTLPAGKYACMYKKGGYYDTVSYQVLLDWCTEHEYKPVGNICDFCIVDYTFSKSDETMIQEIQIRIE